MLPGPSASKVTTLWRYINLFIIIIIFLPQYSHTHRMKQLRYAIQKVQKSSWNEPYSSSSFTKQSCSIIIIIILTATGGNG